MSRSCPSPSTIIRSKSPDKQTGSAPAPPKRKSSRNNTTLRLISTVKVKSEKSPLCRRHETCFTSPSSEADNKKVKYLREKITCKLKTVSKKSEPKAKSRTSSTSPNLNPLKKSESLRTFGEEKKRFHFEPFNSKIEPKSTPKNLDKINILKSKTISKLTAKPKVNQTRTSFLRSRSEPSRNKLSGSKSSLLSKSVGSRSNSPATSNKSTSTLSLTSMTSKPESSLVRIKNPKTNKDKINDEIIKKSSRRPDAKVRHPIDHFVKRICESRIQDKWDELERESRFRNWYLNKFFGRRNSNNSESSIGAMRFYLESTKPVTDSKFRSLDRVLRSRSASPRSDDTISQIHSKRSSSLPAKLVFTETSRPVTPVVQFRSPSPPKRPPTPESITRPLSKLYPRPISSPILSSKFIHFAQPRSPSYRRISKFKELNNFYSDIEKLDSLEKVFDRKPHKAELELMDYDKWQVVRMREKAEKEFSKIRDQVMEQEQENGFFFASKAALDRFRWRKELDHGLRVKEKSVEDLKDEFEKVALEFDGRGSKKYGDKFERRSLSEGRYPRKIIDPATERFLTRGVGSKCWSSLSMEQINNLKEQLSEIYRPDLPRTESFKKKSYEIQVPEHQNYSSNLYVRRNSDSYTAKPSNAMSEDDKRQLSQSLSKEAMEKMLQRKPLLPLVVPKEILGAKAAADANLHWSRDPETEKGIHDKLQTSLIISKDLQEKLHKSLQTLNEFHKPLQTSRELQEILKESLTMSKELKSKLQESIKTTRELQKPSGELQEKLKNSLVKSKELQEALKSAKELQEPLNASKELQEKLKESLKTAKELQKPLKKCEELGEKLEVQETESESTDDSTRTVIFVPKDEVKKKVEYFEQAKEESYIPTIYKPAEIDNENESFFEKYSFLSQCETQEKETDKKESVGDSLVVKSGHKLKRSGSAQNLQEFFGEENMQKFATIPLSATRKTQEYSLPESPKLRSKHSKTSLTIDDSNLEGFPSGKVENLRQQFEFLEDFYSGRVALRKWKSESDLMKDRSEFWENLEHLCPIRNFGYVDDLRRRYEFPGYSGRGRSRFRRSGVLKAEDRFMPHINIISKIASLYRDRDRDGGKRSVDIDLPFDGKVEKLRDKFNRMRDISLLGHAFTSTPDIKELRDIGPYLTASWIAHKYPYRQDNEKKLNNKDVGRMVDTKKEPIRRYQPADESKTDNCKEKTKNQRYKVWPKSSQVIKTKPSVSFKDPEPPVPPPKSHQSLRKTLTESPRKYVENEVTIHYKTPVRQEVKECLSEDELAIRQAEAMKRIYEEERRRKYLEQLQDINSRRHTDNFIPSQKSPIPLNRYDDFDALVAAPPMKPQSRSPEPRLLAKALYNFVGQSSRELTFKKGDVIYVRRQIDKNWYEGEVNAMVGLFPVNYVEIISPQAAPSVLQMRKPHEGQARAKYNFIAQTHLELSLAKGELVTITRRVDENWFEGKIGGRRGIFPVSYVEVLIDPHDPPPFSTVSTKPVASPAAHSLLHNGTAGGKESMGSHSYLPSLPSDALGHTSYHAKPVQVIGTDTYGSLGRGGKSPVDQALHIETQSEPIAYRALYKYKPQNEDELELMEGDIVYVLEKCDDGWFVGSSDRSGAFGTFPGNYVEKV